jgi:hypothetical protein
MLRNTAHPENNPARGSPDAGVRRDFTRAAGDRPRTPDRVYLTERAKAAAEIAFRVSM